MQLTAGMLREADSIYVQVHKSASDLRCQWCLWTSELRSGHCFAGRMIQLTAVCVTRYGEDSEGQLWYHRTGRGGENILRQEAKTNLRAADGWSYTASDAMRVTGTRHALYPLDDTAIGSRRLQEVN